MVTMNKSNYGKYGLKILDLRLHFASLNMNIMNLQFYLLLTSFQLRNCKHFLIRNPSTQIEKKTYKIIHHSNQQSKKHTHTQNKHFLSYRLLNAKQKQPAFPGFSGESIFFIGLVQVLQQRLYGSP